MPDYDALIAEAREATRPDAETLARVAADVRRREARPSRPAWVAPAAGVLAAAAALAFALRPPPDVSGTLGEVPAAALGEHVLVSAEGEGMVAGNGEAMVMTWQRGRLSVEVEPDQGVDLEVKTEEGSVFVVGTGFDVERGPIGTTVNVRHGRVRVECVRSGVSMLGAGESRVCLPTTPAGALRRILAVQAGVTPAVLLDEVDAALALPGAEGAVAGELHALRVDTLLAAERPLEAAAAAETALAQPTVTRAEELHRLAAELRLGAGDCSGARPHVEALRALDRLGTLAEAWARCEGP
jgi:hypothetical protein